jgi:hypothetical protein
MSSRTLASLTILLAACGARDLEAGDPEQAPSPTMLFVGDRSSCALDVDPADATSVLAPGDSSTEYLDVVEILFASECTDLGGQYVLARAIDGYRHMWLGAHGCYSFSEDVFTGEIVYGVARSSQTAALFRIDEGVCVGFPDEGEPPSSDVTTLAIGVFADLGSAQAFVDSAR